MNAQHSAVLYSIATILMLSPITLAQDGLPYDIANPDPNNDWWAEAVASGGDVNHDAKDDILLIDPAYVDEFGQEVGKWWMHSGADGSLLWSIVGTVSSGGDGACAAFVGDVDGDNCSDVLLGVPLARESRGYVALLSGKRGRILRVWNGTEPGQRMGRDVAAAGDANNDGTPDFAYIAESVDHALGTAVIRSGIDGAELTHARVDAPRRLRCVPDLNGDNHDDWVVSSWPQEGYDPVVIRSGMFGSEHILELNPPDPPRDWEFGYAIAAGHDVTGDGIPDIALSGRLGRRVYLYSGATGGLVRTYENENLSESLFGVYLAFVDMNGDEEYELLIASEYVLHIYEPLSGNELFRILAGGTQHGRWYGNEYAYGDFNGDGSTDLIPGHTGNSDLSVTLWGGGRLLLSTPCDFTLRRRSSCTFSIYGDAPGRTVHLMASHAGNGCTFIPKLGLCLDLDQPFMEVATAVTDLEGWARMEVKVPADAPPGTVWLQAIDPNHYWLGPITSNVWRMMVG